MNILKKTTQELCDIWRIKIKMLLVIFSFSSKCDKIILN
jgi:hypothetical protein